MKEQYALKFPLLLMIVMSALLLFGRTLSGQGQNVNWDKLEQDARIYFDYPSTENAYVFCQDLPEQPLRVNFDLNRYNRLFTYVFENLDVLARQVSAGDRDAVKLAFRLYNFSDGLYTMELDAMLGDLIRTHPQLFLEELRSSPNARLVKTLGYPLCDSSLNIHDMRDRADRYELEMRIKALESVEDSVLADLRNACIRGIRECLDKNYHDSPGILLSENEYQTLFKQTVINVCNEAEIAYQICHSVAEIEDASLAGPFGSSSEKIVHSSGLFDELTALKDKSIKVNEVLSNPPLAYAEEHKVLKTMESRAIQLYHLATQPSFISPSGTSDDIKRSTYKRAPARYYSEFMKAYAELASLMPEIRQVVKKNMVDLEAIKKRLGQRN